MASGSVDSGSTTATSLGESLLLPDYKGGSIVNLMSSISTGLGLTSEDCPAGLLQSTALAEARNIILVVIDGLGYNALRRDAAGGYLESRLLGSLTSVCPTTTASAIPTFLTGKPPQQHGFTGWFTYFRELGDILAVLPFVPRHGGSLLSDAGYTPGQLCGADSLFEQMNGIACSQVMPAWIADSSFNRSFAGNADTRAYKDLKHFFKAIRHAIGRRSRHYVYAYWPLYDSLSHNRGVADPQVVEHLQQLDQGLERLCRDLSGSDTALLVTADHGFIDTELEHTIYLHDHPELQQTLLLPICGEPRLSYCYVHPREEARFCAYIREELGHAVELVESERMIAEGWFGVGKMFPPLRDRVGHYALVMRDNYKIKDWILGEREYNHIGVHGGLSADEMFVPLVYDRL